MELRCGCEKMTRIKVEADTGADPLWCPVCGYNLDMDHITLSASLKEQLRTWIHEYGRWINWDSDSLMEGGESLERQHNEAGRTLAEQVREEVREEVKGRYAVVFSPSAMYKDRG